MNSPASQAIMTAEAVDEARCAVCGRLLRPGYRLRGGALRCFRHAITYPAVLKRSLITALIVGTVLTSINQGDRILAGNTSTEMWIKIALTYCVPFCVSTSGAIGAARRSDTRMTA